MARCFVLLIALTMWTQIAMGEAIHNIEAGRSLTVSGRVCGANDQTILVDTKTGLTFRLHGYSLKEQDSATISGQVTVFPNGQGFSLGLRPLITRRLSETSTKASSSLSSQVSHLRSLEFPSQVESAARKFISSYLTYRVAAFKTLQRTLSPSMTYEQITSCNRQAYSANKSLYRRAMVASDEYLEACRTNGIWKNLNVEEHFLLIDKHTGLMSVIDESSGFCLFTFPFAYGANPDGKAKERDGDLRTPETPKGMESPSQTPIFIGRRAAGTVAPGMTVRCMGLDSKRLADAFWVAGGMNIAIHGTPVHWSMGLRASHGCCRVLEGQIPYLYSLTTKGTPVIILGAEGSPPSSILSPVDVRRQIRTAYQSLLGRPADSRGLDYYTSCVLDGRLSIAGVKAQMRKSPEFTAYMEGSLKALYRRLLQREPDQAGFEYYMSRLRQGETTLAQIEEAIKRSPEYEQSV